MASIIAGSAGDSIDSIHLRATSNSPGISKKLSSTRGAWEEGPVKRPLKR